MRPTLAEAEAALEAGAKAGEDKVVVVVEVEQVTPPNMNGQTTGPSPTLTAANLVSTLITHLTTIFGRGFPMISKDI